MWLYFLITVAFSVGLTICIESAKKVSEKRKQQQFLHHLALSSEKKRKDASSPFLNEKLRSSHYFSPFHFLLNFLQKKYDLPKDLNLVHLIFIQFGLLFICWNMSGFLKISLIPLLLLAISIEIIGTFFFLSRRKLLDQLDKAFPQMLDSISSMYQIHPDLKHSFVSSQELMIEPVSKRFLTELTRLTKLGVPTVQSLQLMAERWKYPPLFFMISSIKIHESTGGDLAQLLRQMASSLRRHQQNTKAMQSVMFQNKVSGFVVCALVPVVLLLSISLSQNYRSVIFGEPMARSLVIAACVWWLIGVAVMWKTLKVRV